MRLNVLCAGAAKAVVGAIAAQTGDTLEGAYGAVGAMRDRLLAGEPCDLIVLTRAMLDQLAAEGRVAGETIGDLGRVRTGVAVPQGAPRPDLGTAQALRAALLAATSIYVPDTQQSTAGRHVAGVLVRLGIAETVRARLREYPNGATAMRAMGDAGAAGERGAIGSTQVSEILYSAGVALAGVLPAEFELSTVYSAAACSTATQPGAARALVRQLVGAGTQVLRRDAGFEA